MSSKSVGSWATIPILCRKNSVLVLEVSYPSTSYNTVKAYFCEVHPGWSGFWTEFGSNRKREIYLPLGRRRYHKIVGAAAYMSTCHSRIDRPKPMFVLLWLKYRIPKVVFIFGLFSLSLRWGLECLAGSGRWTGDFWSECCPGNCPICVLKTVKIVLKVTKYRLWHKDQHMQGFDPTVWKFVRQSPWLWWNRERKPQLDPIEYHRR